MLHVSQGEIIHFFEANKQVECSLLAQKKTDGLIP